MDYRKTGMRAGRLVLQLSPAAHPLTPPDIIAPEGIPLVADGRREK